MVIVSVLKSACGVHAGVTKVKSAKGLTTIDVGGNVTAVLQEMLLMLCGKFHLADGKMK